MQQIFPYRFSKEKKRNDRFEYLHQFSFSANNLEGGNPVYYLVNFYRCKQYLYIIDFFPEEWNNQPDCTNKILCREEEARVNFRKIIKTCFTIFHHEISPIHEDAALVISGSLTKDEQPLPGLSISRKLKFYWQVLEPIAQSLNYRMIKIFEMSTIIFIRKSSTLPDEKISKDFVQFKQQN